MKSSLRTRKAILALPLIAALGAAAANAALAADPASPSPTSSSDAPQAAPTGSAEAAPPPASAAPSSSAEAAPRPSRSIAEWIPPEERSDKPTSDEWANAVPLALVRAHPWCTASAVREWLRVSCVDVNHHYKGVRVMGGSEKDVSIDDYTLKEGKETVYGLHIMIPVRKGDRRILSINSWDWGGYKSFMLLEDLATVISALWLPGDRAPVITVHGAAFKGEQQE